MKYTSILFVCHGNICRSPMAEFVMKALVRKAELEPFFRIESAGTSSEESGNPVYSPVQRLLALHGIPCGGKYARKITANDYRDYDMLIGMEEINIRNMTRFFGGDPEGKFSLLMDYTDTPRDVDDPWYSGDFTGVWNDVQEGCCGLLKFLKEKAK